MTDESLRGSLRAEIKAECLDLSEGGALLFLSTPLDLGVVHDFALELDNETVWVQAEVRHLKPAACHGLKGYEVGVQFIGIDPHDEERLKSYLARTGVI